MRLPLDVALDSEGHRRVILCCALSNGDGLVDLCCEVLSS